MTNAALIVGRSGQLTAGITTLVAAQAYEPVSTLVTERPEHGRYYLSPATIEESKRRISEHDPGSSLLVVDGTPHPGQLADLQARLSPITVVDTRMAICERLSEANPAAATYADLWTTRIARRRAANAQREAATRSPSGESGRVAQADERIQRLRDRLERHRDAAHRRVREQHTGVDASVVLLGRFGAPTTTLWATLAGEDAANGSGPGRPAQPATARTTLGPHTLAVTDTPGVPGGESVPEWLSAALPGLPAALERARYVVWVGEGSDPLLTAVSERFDVRCRSPETADAAVVERMLTGLLPSDTCVVRLPYSDAAHALVSKLHDETTVRATEYDDAIHLRLDVARASTDELRRRVTAVGGEVKQLGATGSG